jgi:hypothetical protein
VPEQHLHGALIVLQCEQHLRSLFDLVAHIQKPTPWQGIAMQELVFSWAITQVSQVVVDVFVGIVVSNVVITGPNKRVNHGSHTAGKLLVAALAHGLQHSNLLIFDFTINLKVI